MRFNENELKRVAVKLISPKTSRYVLITFFVCIIAYQLAGVIYKTISFSLAYRSSPAGVETKRKTDARKDGNPEEWEMVIVGRNLFGSVKEPAQKGAPSDFLGQGVASNRWELKGTIVFNNFVGYAILSDKTKGNQILLKTGTKIEGTTLLKVGRDTCVIEEDGKRYLLLSSQAKLSSLLPGEKTMEAAITISRKDVMAHMSNLTQMLNEARIVPYIVEGNAAGFQILQVVPGSLLQKMGLAAGDVVQEINDRKIVGAEDINQLFQTLQTSTSMTITVLRGGRTERLSYQFI